MPQLARCTSSTIPGFRCRARVGYCYSRLVATASLPIPRRMLVVLRVPLVIPKSRLNVLQAYENWRRTVAPSELTNAQSDVRRKDEHLSEKLAAAIAMHRHRLKEVDIPYGGTTEPDGRGPIRNTVCRGCHRDIGTEAHLKCNQCTWIVCLSCGACGCGWAARPE